MKYMEASHQKIIKKSILTFLFIISVSISAWAQVNIFELMERTDLKIDEVEKIANDHFQKVGTAKGSGYKQYSRWFYERKFHSDENGYFISPEKENAAYLKFTGIQKKNKAGSITWNELGPQSWTYTSGWNPGVGRITSVAVHPSDTTKIYVTSPGGGIWKSTNSGSSWSPLIDNVNSGWMTLMHICIDPSNQNTIYACASSVIKSTDAGANWASTGSGPSSPKKVLVHPSNSSIIFSTGTNGIWRSTNGGTSWTQVSTVTAEDIEFNPNNPNVMYASGNSASGCVWRSTNNGVNWTVVGSGSGITATGRTLIAVSANNPAVVYAVQASGSLFGKFYKSSDTGKTYTTMITGSAASGTNFFGYEPTGTGTTGQATYDMAICVNPGNVDEIHIAGIICWKSTDGGTSFNPETEWSYPNSTGYNHADVHALEWFKNTIYSGSDGGIFKSINNGNDWINLSTGLGIRQFYKIACSKTNSSVITGGAQDNGTVFRQSGGNWVDWLGADGMDNIISPTNAAIAIGTSQYGAIYKTTNSGASRSNLSQPASGNWVTPLVMHPTNHDTVYGGWTGIWRSSNGGTSWTNISSGVITGTLTAIAVAPSNTKYIYGSIGSTLYRTNNGGVSWTSVSAAASITSIFVSQSNPEKIWITCNSSSARVYVSTNMGTSFTDLSSGLPAVAARSIVVENNSLEGVYVGMNIGVYYRDNTNTTWVQHGSNLPLVAINEVEIQESSSKLRVATYGRGVWESDLQNSGACQLPSNLSANSINLNSAQISWTAASGAVNYTIEYKATSSSTWIGTTTTSNTSFSLNGLASGTYYDWHVRTNCATNNSAYIQSSFTTAANCASVTGLNTGGISLNSGIISWNAISGSLSYLVEYKESSSSSWGGTTTTTNSSLNLSGLNANTSYDWRVKTNCTFDSSSFVVSSFTTANCGAPSNLNASSIGLSNATLAWNPVGASTYYTFEYKISSSSTWGGTTNTSNTSLNLSGLAPSTVYNWRVKTNCTSDSSILSESSFTTASCNTPAGLSTNNIISNGATVSWNSVAGATYYIVQYKPTSSSTWSNGLNTNALNLTINGLNASTSYDWRVKTNCTIDSSNFSQSTFTTISCGTPTNPAVSNLTSNSVTVSWNAISGATSYSVEYKLSSSNTWLTTTPTSNTFYNLTGLSNGVYNWRVYGNCGSSNTYLTSSFTIYCSSAGTSTSAEYIGYVGLGTLVRTSGSDGGYYNGTSMSSSLKPGTQYIFYFSPKFTGSSRNEYFRVFIDYNGDGDFADANEQIGQKSTNRTSKSSLKFTVPTNATLGSTRMRVSMKYNAYATSCETFSNGEVEDYSVLITKTPEEPPMNNDIENTANELLIYPIPATNEMNYSFIKDSDFDNISTIITNIEGKELYNRTFNHGKGLVSEQIQLDNFANGMYYLLIKTESDIKVQKFLITR